MQVLPLLSHTIVPHITPSPRLACLSRSRGPANRQRIGTAEPLIKGLSVKQKPLVVIFFAAVAPLLPSTGISSLTSAAQHSATNNFYCIMPL